MSEASESIAREFVEAEFGSLEKNTLSGRLITLLAASWSLFQLYLPCPGLPLIDSVTVRCIHLAFAIALVYLCFPALKRRGRLFKWMTRDGTRFGFTHHKHGVPWIDVLTACVAAGAALYLALDFEGIGMRQGQPALRDMVIGLVLIGLLLEAARRALGPALPVIAGLFILYSMNSESMPAMISFKNASLSKLLSKLTLSTEGVFGVPLDVSASTVFLFVLFGAMLDKAGGGQYFIQLAFSLLGRFKGGPAKAAVLASGLTGMVSGSSIANTVTTGTFTIPLMKRCGYPGIKAGAIEVAASTNGQLMPPIMGAAAFIIAEYCNLTYFEVVRAAFVPAVISYLALIYITHLEACKLGLKGLPASELPPFWKTFFGGIHFIIPILFLLHQLVIERQSAQKSAFYAIIALAALMVIRNFVTFARQKAPLYRAALLSAAELWESLVAGGRNMMSIGVAVAAAGIIVGIVTLGLGNVITEVIDVISMGNLFLLLIITALASLLLGMGLPTTANYIVMASLTAPAILVLAGEAGLAVPIIAAHLFCFYFGILADDTPPVGLAAYAAAAISGEDPIQTGIQGFLYDSRTAILPFMFIFNTDLLLIGVEHWWHIAAVLFTGTIAMFAFAALTQGWLLARNRWYEAFLLAGVAFMLLRADLFSAHVGLNRVGWYGIGLVLFAGIHFLQFPRKPKRNTLPASST